jgi:hypothetical protein
MNDTFHEPSAGKGATLNEGTALPELQHATLDAATVEQLFHDIEHCTEVIEVIPKFSRGAYVSVASIGLQEGKERLLGGELRALQLRYRYAGAEWWDTLMATPAGLRLVRIEHHF